MGKCVKLSNMKYVDVLVDGEYKESMRDVNLCWKGSKNQRVIDVQKSLMETKPTTPVLYCNDYS